MKRPLRRLMRTACRVPIRGRYRAANTLGRLLAPGAVETVDVDGIAFPVDHSISVYRHIYYGLYEPENVAEIRAAVRLGDTCIDVGANVGYITTVMAGAVGPSGHVYAFEAAPRCVEILDFLRDVPQVEVVPAAAAAYSGSARFHETDRILTKGYGYLSDVRGPSNSTEHEVQTWALDDFCEERGIDRVRYLKIDVEGGEPLVIRGAKRLLGERRADYVLTEMSSAGKEDEIAQDAAVRQLLTGFGYQDARHTGRDVLWRPTTQDTPK